MHQIAFTQWTHDIRNALSTIALYVDTLDCPENPQSGKTVAATQALLGRIAAMCSSAAKQTERSAPAVRASHDVARTIAQARDLIVTILPKGVSFKADTQGPMPVVADAQDVFRILFNLLHNAVMVSRRNQSLRAIRVKLERAGAMVTIAVSDDGPGLPAAVRSRLFLGARSSNGGSGRGLAIARELAERNGGSLKLAEVQQGTEFVVELPLDPSAVDHIETLFRARATAAATNAA